MCVHAHDPLSSNNFQTVRHKHKATHASAVVLWNSNKLCCAKAQDPEQTTWIILQIWNNPGFRTRSDALMDAMCVKHS